MSRRILGAVLVVCLIEALYLTAFNFSKHSVAGLVMMYILAVAPTIVGFYLLSARSENMQQRFLRFMHRKGL